MEQQNQQVIITEVTIKGDNFRNLMNYINDLPHRYGKELEIFINQVAQENYLEKNPPKEEKKEEQT